MERTMTVAREFLPNYRSGFSVRVRIAYEDTEMRELVKRLGMAWLASQRQWRRIYQTPADAATTVRQLLNLGFTVYESGGMAMSGTTVTLQKMGLTDVAVQ
jgi:hypothetical protein